MKTINVALCSFGMSGWVFHAPFLQAHPGYNFYAVYERSKDLAKQRYSSVTVYRDLDAMLADPAVDLVIANAPNATHYEYAKKALRAGKHVVVEKPFTVTIAEADELIALAQQQQKIISVYHNRRWDSDFKTVQKIVQSGALGNVMEAEFHYDRYNEALSPKVHKETPGPGNGALYDLGSHLIDQALQLFGMPDAVFADVAIMRPVSQVDDYFELLMFYPGMRVRIKSTYVALEPVPSFVLHGTKGSFLKNRGDVQEVALQQQAEVTAGDWGREKEADFGLLVTNSSGKVCRERVPSESGNYMDFYNGLYQAIVSGTPLPVTASQGRDVIRVIEAAYRSRSEKKVVNL